MRLTSRDIARQDFPKRLLGWSPQDVRAFLQELARALDDLRAMNEALTRRAASLEAAARTTAASAPPVQELTAPPRTAEISREEAQGIIREAEAHAQQITGAARAELLRLGEQITILESKQESVARKLRQFLNAELEIEIGRAHV